MIDFKGFLYEDFLAQWARLLLSIPSATAVYYIGTSAWLPSSGSKVELQVVPNFIVRTDDPHWGGFVGMPVGRARHDIIFEADQELLQGLCSRWSTVGWAPDPDDGFRLNLIDPKDFVRVIEVPASSKWAGPEYLKNINDGVSLERIFQESLRRYGERFDRFEEPAHYIAVDESAIAV